MKTILVEVGEVHHVAIIKVGIEKEDWHLVNICLLLMLWWVEQGCVCCELHVLRSW